MDHIRRFSRVVTITVLAASAVACGGDDDDETADTTESTEATPEGVSTTAPGAASEGSTPEPEPDTTPSGGTTSPADTTSPTATTAPTLPLSGVCDNLYPLVENDLNDECYPGPRGWPPIMNDVNNAGVWNSPDCADMVAVPDEVIVAIDPTVPVDPDDPEVLVDLETESEIVVGQIGVPLESFEDSGNARLLRFQPGSLSAQQMLDMLPTLQSRGRRVDLNYLEPLQPNDGFRPYDNPVPVDTAPAAFGGQTLSVLVIDSPAEGEEIVYDRDANGLVDEDHGHGPFVRSMIERSGPAVRLHGIPPDDDFVMSNGRWSPMMFDDFGIITALNTIDNESVVNLSLGGVGCHLDALEPGVGERLALAQIMSNMVNSEDTSFQWFVAAAGNNGTDDVLHFPAAWRHPDVARGLVDFLRSVQLDDVADEIEAIQATLRDSVIAVGSVEPEPVDAPRNDLRSDFSNCGAWINGAAYGRWQVATYPATPAVPAAWSGTSFATANFTAALASGLVAPASPFDPLAFDSNTGARMMDPGRGLDCNPSSAGTGTPP
jgi:hypothetical protein